MRQLDNGHDTILHKPLGPYQNGKSPVSAEGAKCYTVIWNIRFVDETSEKSKGTFYVFGEMDTQSPNLLWIVMRTKASYGYFFAQALRVLNTQHFRPLPQNHDGDSEQGI